MTCEKHDYHVVVIETVTEFQKDKDGEDYTTTTQNSYELYCQACGEKLPAKE